MTMKETFERYRLLVEDALSQASHPMTPRSRTLLCGSRWRTAAGGRENGSGL